MSHIGNDAVIDAQRDELDAGDCNKCGAGFGFEIIFCMACGNCGVHCSCKKQETEHRNVNCSLGCAPPDANGNCILCGKKDKKSCINCLMFTCTKHN